MQFTIDRKNTRVSVDGVTRTDVPLDTLPTNTLAVRWWGTFGEVDYINADTPTIKRKRRIVAFADFQPILDLFHTPMPVPPPKTPQQVADEVTAGAQARLDAFALTRRYDNVNSISKYQNLSDAEIGSLPEPERATVGRFRAECRYLALAAARTWAVLDAFTDKVTAGTQPMPAGYADVELLLPPLEWPL